MTYRLLLADDDPAFREIMRELCTPFFEILEAGTGDAAWEIVIDARPDLALCDFHMPGRTGLEALSAFKAIDIRRPAILMSSEVSPDLQQQAQRAHIDSLLEKPFSRKVLLRTFAAVIETAYHDHKLSERLLST